MYKYKHTSNYTHLCNRLLLVESCLCCFFDMLLYSNIYSTIAKISSLIILELFPAYISCNNNFNPSQSSSGSDGKIFVFEIPEAQIIKPGDLSNFINVRSQVDLLPGPLTSKFIFFCKIIQ